MASAPDPGRTIPHGLNGYKHYRCECPVCKDAGSAWSRAYNIRRRGEQDFDPLLLRRANAAVLLVASGDVDGPLALSHVVWPGALLLEAEAA